MVILVRWLAIQVKSRVDPVAFEMDIVAGSCRSSHNMPLRRKREVSAEWLVENPAVKRLFAERAALQLNLM